MNYTELTIKELLSLVKEHYKRNGYTTASPPTLVLGIVEEVGELAQTVLYTECTDYTPRKNKVVGEISSEIGDVLVYCLALCNKLGIEPTFRNLHKS